jgi:excinuclease ABC subunit C
LPDLIIVDGGKGQLKYDQEVLYLFQEEFERKGFSPNIEICSLAKREEEVFVPSDYYPNSSERGQEGGIILEGQTKFLIQRIRDEAHRFAISNNRKARLKEVSRSELDSIKGIGPKTKESLLSYFGSVKNMLLQLHENEEIFHELIGKKSTSKLKEYFNLP